MVRFGFDVYVSKCGSGAFNRFSKSGIITLESALLLWIREDLNWRIYSKIWWIVGLYLHKLTRICRGSLGIKNKHPVLYVLPYLMIIGVSHWFVGTTGAPYMVSRNIGGPDRVVRNIGGPVRNTGVPGRVVRNIGGPDRVVRNIGISDRVVRNTDRVEDWAIYKTKVFKLDHTFPISATIIYVRFSFMIVMLPRS